MKKTRDGRRRFSREFKVAAVRRVAGGESMARVARELDISEELLWRWKKRVFEKGEGHLYGIGQRESSPSKVLESEGASQRQRIADLERLVGEQQLEIRFLGKALRRVEELRQQKNDDGAAASSKQ
jgi:transposase-like protein